MSKGLPRNAKEGILFTLIVAFLSVNTIPVIIMGLQLGFSKETYIETLKLIPVLFIIIVFIVNVIARPIVNYALPKLSSRTDSFNAKVLFNILLNVTIISLIMSIIGAWIGAKQISLEPFKNFFHVWPRNFGIAFWIEVIFAQPIARFVMRKIQK